MNPRTDIFGTGAKKFLKIPKPGNLFVGESHHTPLGKEGRP